MIYHGCDELRPIVEAMGFRLYADHSREGINWIACKRIPNTRRCECNDDKDGVQIVVKPHEFTIHGRVHRGVEIDITGQSGGRWYKLMGYSIGADEFEAAYPAVHSALLRAWEALA